MGSLLTRRGVLLTLVTCSLALLLADRLASQRPNFKLQFDRPVAQNYAL